MVGAFPKASYGPLLERLAKEGYCIIATPLPFSLFNHGEAAGALAQAYTRGEAFVESVYGNRLLQELPIFGLGHSLGAKMHILLGSSPALSSAMG